MSNQQTAPLRVVGGQAQPEQAPATKPTKHVIKYELHGFPIETTCYGKAEVITGLVEKLRASGAVPPAQGATNAATKTGGQSKTPSCPLHRIPMKESRKKGTYFCPKKDEDTGDYCDEKA